jgi:hypothetical protein
MQHVGGVPSGSVRQADLLQRRWVRWLGRTTILWCWSSMGWGILRGWTSILRGRTSILWRRWVLRRWASILRRWWILRLPVLRRSTVRSPVRVRLPKKRRILQTQMVVAKVTVSDRLPLACRHLGPPTGELIRCPTCSHTRVRAFACAIYGACTIYKDVGIPCCSGRLGPGGTSVPCPNCLIVERSETK